MTKRIKVLLVSLALLAMASGGAVYRSIQPDFTTLSGQSYQWREFEGQWVVVNYFAEWCAPCLREIPELNAFTQQQNKVNARLFAVSFDALPTERLQTIKADYQIEFDLLNEIHQPMPMEKPQSLPATYIISPRGEVVKRLMGEQSVESLNHSIGLLKASQS